MPDVEGIARRGDVGGQPKQRYFLPDGSSVYAMPDMHEYQQLSGGKVVGQGIRDVNLDRGWLLTKPDKLQLYCSGCDKWHNTPEEVTSCIQKKETSAKAWREKAKAELKESDEMASLKSDMTELKSMFSQILKELKK